MARGARPTHGIKVHTVHSIKRAVNSQAGGKLVSAGDAFNNRTGVARIGNFTANYPKIAGFNGQKFGSYDQPLVGQTGSSSYYY